MADHYNVTINEPQLALQADVPVIDQVSATDAAWLQLLIGCGLSDAFSWARLPHELSQGQQQRLDMACHFAFPADPVIIDGFCEHLDDATARAVAWTAGAMARKLGRGLIVATVRAELAADLRPDVIIRKTWDPEPHVETLTAWPGCCSLIERIRYRPGTLADWRKLKHLHYAAGDPATVHSAHVLHLDTDPAPIAVALLSWPDLHSAARNLDTDDRYKLQGNAEATHRLNREVVKLSRIVIAPEFRGIGLTRMLLAELIEKVRPRYIESTTALGRWNPFLLSLGFREVPQATAAAEADLLEWAESTRVPPQVALDSSALRVHVDGLSVRGAREARRIVWRHYHHFVLHRRTRKPYPKVVPAPTDDRWPEAFDLAASRINGRPTYYILGPLDPMTGLPE